MVLIRTNYLQLNFLFLFLAHFFHESLLQRFFLLEMLRKIERLGLDYDTRHSKLRFKVMNALHDLCKFFNNGQIRVEVLLVRAERTTVPYEFSLRSQCEFASLDVPVIGQQRNLYHFSVF